VFDCTRKITYQHLEDWYKELQTYRPGLPTLIVANKIDIDYNVVKKSFGFPAKHEHCAPNVYFTSAADGTNVVKLFDDAIRFALQYKINPDEQDFTEEVMAVIDYFDAKEKKQQQKS
jgi:Rab-like protein 2